MDGKPVEKSALGLPRTPASQVSVTTCWSGGSLANAFGKLQGLAGSAQPSSMDVLCGSPANTVRRHSHW